MSKSLFVEKYVDEYLIKLNIVNQFWNQVNYMFIETKKMHEGLSDKEIYDTIFANKDTIRIIFYGGKKKSNGNDVRHGRFYHCKKLILCFLNYLRDNDLITDYKFIYDYVKNLKEQDIVILNYEEEIYFEKIEDIINKIDTIGKICFDNVRENKKNFAPYSNDDLLVYKSLAILLWNGFTLAEILHLKTEDLIARGDKYYVLYNKKITDITKYEYDILKLYSMTLSQRGLPSGRTVYYVDNEYLVKPPKYNGKDNVKISDLFSYIKKINLLSAKLKLPFLFNQYAIRMSGYFSRIYNKYPDDEIMALKYLSKITEVDIDQYTKTSFYLQWVEMFKS